MSKGEQIVAWSIVSLAFWPGTMLFVVLDRAVPSLICLGFQIVSGLVAAYYTFVAND